MAGWNTRIGTALAITACLFAARDSRAQGVTPARILEYKPAQADIVIDNPAPADVAKCKLQEERTQGGSGFVLYNPEGLLLRRFLDTQSAGTINEFRYYQNGIEVYRESDTNKNGKLDQFRWLNTAGTRWGVDLNEDGTIDAWKMISAEEASREAIMALVTRNQQRLLAVMITPEEINQLGITGEAGTALTEGVRGAAQAFQAAVTGNRIITPATRWTRFDCSMLMPNLIPAEPGKTKSDLTVYENVMAIVDNAGEAGFVQVGEMILVGQTWKITQVPRPLVGDRVELDGGKLLQPVLAGIGGADGLSPALRDLIDKLKALDDKAPAEGATPQQFAAYNVSRSQILAELAKEASTPEEKQMWLRQRIELIATAAQMDTFPNGPEELSRMEQVLRQDGTSPDLLAFAVLQRMGVEHNLKLRNTTAAEDQKKLQEEWQVALQSYIKEFQRSPDAGAAVFELARLFEFNGNTQQATTWYQQLVTSYPNAPSAARGKGAILRLGMKGKPLQLTGQVLGGGTFDSNAYRGRVLAVLFWSTWCQPCTNDLPQIQELYKTYRRNGFEVIGVNLDNPGAPIQQYITTHKVEWPHIHEIGGLDSRPALEFGIISLPTVFLVDKRGNVVLSGASVQDLKEQVPELVK